MRQSLNRKINLWTRSKSTAKFVCTNNGKGSWRDQQPSSHSPSVFMNSSKFSLEASLYFFPKTLSTISLNIFYDATDARLTSTATVLKMSSSGRFNKPPYIKKKTAKSGAPQLAVVASRLARKLAVPMATLALLAKTSLRCYERALGAVPPRKDYLVHNNCSIKCT